MTMIYICMDHTEIHRSISGIVTWESVARGAPNFTEQPIFDRLNFPSPLFFLYSDTTISLFIGR